jgi:hypothetical protein
MLSDEEKEVLKDLTGCIPLLLRPLFAFPGKRFDRVQLMKSDEFQNVRMDVKSFFEDRTNALHKVPREQKEYVIS